VRFIPFTEYSATPRVILIDCLGQGVGKLL
jgi:hypothetical protein